MTALPSASVANPTARIMGIDEIREYLGLRTRLQAREVLIVLRENFQLKTLAARKWRVTPQMLNAALARAAGKVAT